MPSRSDLPGITRCLCDTERRRDGRREAVQEQSEEALSGRGAQKLYRAQGNTEEARQGLRLGQDDVPKEGVPCHTHAASCVPRHLVCMASKAFWGGLDAPSAWFPNSSAVPLVMACGLS